MLGRDHALLGAAAYLAVDPLVSHLAHSPVPSPVQLAVGTAVCAGFALLPDIDEPGSTISRKLGPISEAVSVVTNKVAGGHRQATHSLMFVALTFLGAHFALRSPIAIGAIVFCALAISLRMILPLRIGRASILSFGLIIGATIWVVHAHDVGSWLPYACAGGVFLHLVGDALTIEGVPFFWVPFVHPLQKIRLAVPILGHTASLRESLVGTCLMISIVFLGYVHVVLPEAKQVPSKANTTSAHVHVPHVHAPKPGSVKKDITNLLKKL